MTQTDFYSMTSAELKAEIARGNFPPIAGADDAGEAVAEAPVTPPAEAEAAPEVVEDASLAETVKRVAEAQQQPVEEAEEPPAAAEETPTEEVAETPEAEETETPAYTQDDIDLVEAGDATAEGYDEAVQRLDDAGMIEYEEAEEEVPPENETDEQRMLRELYEDKQRRDQQELEREQAAAEQNAADEFMAELDKFMPEGESFPRDSKDWTDAQKIQASLTASYESAEKAQEMLKSYADAQVTEVINSKPDPAAPPNTDGAVTPAKETPQLPRDGIAEAAKRQFAANSAQVG